MKLKFDNDKVYKTPLACPGRILLNFYVKFK